MTYQYTGRRKTAYSLMGLGWSFILMSGIYILVNLFVPGGERMTPGPFLALLLGIGLVAGGWSRVSKD